MAANILNQVLCIQIGKPGFLSLCVFAFFGFFVCDWLEITERPDAFVELSKVRRTRQIFQEVGANQSYLILVWNKFPPLGVLPWTSDAFQNCPFSNCVITQNKTRINESSAVVIHTFKHWKKPDYRSPKQTWIAA